MERVPITPIAALFHGYLDLGAGAVLGVGVNATDYFTVTFTLAQVPFWAYA